MKSPLLAITLLLAVASAGLAQRAEKVPQADLAIVPPDAVAFAHVRVADVWKSDSMKEMRELLLKAGDEAIQGFDKRFLPKPSSIDRITVFLLPPTKDSPQPAPILVVATNEAIDREAFLKSTLPTAVPTTVGTQTYHFDKKNDIGVYFLSDRIFAISPDTGIPTLLTRKAGEGPMAEVVQMAIGTKSMVVGLNPSIVPPEAFAQVPAEFRPLVMAKLFTLSLDLKADSQLELQAVYANAKGADDADAVIKMGAKLALTQIKKSRKEMLAKVLGDGKVLPVGELPETAGALFALGAMGMAEEILNDLPIRRKDSRIMVSIKVPQGANLYMGTAAMGVGLMLPAVQKVREAAARSSSANNLKQIALAMLNYESAYGHLPPAAICDKNGKPLLSWRVAILPFIEQNNLYMQFKLDEPWDSKHNLPLSKVMIKTYTHPSAKPAPGMTNYRAFVGNGAALDLKKGARIVDFTDGTSNTLLVAETNDTVIWSKPDDFEYDPKKPLPKLGGLSKGGFQGVLCDGSVRFFSEKISEKMLRAWITRAGGEVIDTNE